MITIPANMRNAWNECVNELAPFETRVVIKSANGGTTYTCASNEIISLVVTRTLYDKASIGCTASSQADMSFLPEARVIDGRLMPPYVIHIGDQISIYIRPAASSDQGDDAWIPQGVFYVLQVNTDAYTNVSEILAADVLTIKGDIMFPIIGDRDTAGYAQSDTYKVETLACNILGTTMSSSGNNRLAPLNSGVLGFFLNGYTTREVLSYFAGGEAACNYIIDYTGKLRRVQFNAQPNTGDAVILGRRAEKITHDGTWSDYRFHLDLTREIKQQDPNNTISRAVEGSAEALTDGATHPMELTTPSFWTKGFASDNAEMLASIYNNGVYARRRYDAFTCTNMVFDPALELGDQVTVLGKAQTSLLADDALNPMLWIEPGNDDTRTYATQPHDYIPYWENQQNDDSLTGPIGKLVVDYKTPQIAQLLQSPAPQG